MQTRSLTESSLLTALFVILAMATAYIPALALVSLLVMSIPHAFITYKHGIKAGIISLVVSSILLVLLMDILTAFTTVTMFATVGIAIGAGAKRLSAGKTIIIGAAVGAISFGVLLVVAAKVMSVDLYGDIIKLYEESFKTGFDSGIFKDAVEYTRIENTFNLLKGTLKPALIFLVGFMVSYIGYKMFQIIGARFKLNIPKMKSLFEWSFPIWVGVVYVAGNVMYLLGSNNELLQAIGLNINVIFQWPIILQGISLLILFFSKYIKSKLFFVLLIVVLLINPLLLRIVSFVGLFDMLFNYRGFVLEKGDKK